MAAEEIREWLERYVKSQVSLEEFEDWFLPATWDDSKTDGRVRQLAAEVRLYLAEVDRGDRSEEQLRRALAELVTRSARRVRSGA